jgi:aldehyde dehydrogenase (NAD+)
MMAERIEQQRNGTPAVPAWEYADAPESKDVVRLQDRYGLFIGGEFVEPKSGRYMPTIDPSTEEVLAEVPEAGPEDVELAVAAARDAFESRWRDLPGTERSKYLYRIEGPL